MPPQQPPLDWRPYLYCVPYPPTSHSFPRASSFSGFIGVACITKRDPVAHDSGPAEEARALESLLTEPIADRVHGSFEPLAARSGRGSKQVELTGIAVAKPGQAHT